MSFAPCKPLAAAAAICALTAPSASAETSSVDAYGGQAAVLGKPGPHRERPGTTNSGAGRSGETAESRSAPRVGGTTGSGPTTGSGSGAGSAGAGGASSGSGGGASGRTRGGAGGSGGPVAATVTARAPGAERSTSRGPSESATALPLSTLDVLLILAGLLCLVAIVLALRRLASHPPAGSETSR